MRRTLKFVVIAVVGLAVMAAVLALLAGWLSERKRNRVIALTVAPVAYAADEASIVRGKYLFDSRGCLECHGSDGAGRVVIDDPGGMYIKSPNISPGPGSVVKNYDETDWVRTIRHGVSPARHPLILMPSKDYAGLTDVDLASVVAYARSLSPAVGEGSVIRFPIIVKGLYAFGAINDDAEKIDHALPPPMPVPEAITTEHGAYVAQACIGCHGEGLSGGKIPGTPPDWPPAANLTPGAGSVMPRYETPEKFSAMLRTGKRPDGAAVSVVMPFESLRNLNDTDIGALYVYLKALPARAAGRR
jgi:mono/diheme cytochrome c family protein